MNDVRKVARMSGSKTSKKKKSSNIAVVETGRICDKLLLRCFHNSGRIKESPLGRWMISKYVLALANIHIIPSRFTAKLHPIVHVGEGFPKISRGRPIHRTKKVYMYVQEMK